MDDYRQRSLDHRAHLRCKVKRLCDRLIRETRGGRRVLPDGMAMQLMFAIHMAQEAMLEHTQSVFRDHLLYDEDAKFVAEQMTASFHAYEAAHGALKMAKMRKAMREKELCEAGA